MRSNLLSLQQISKLQDSTQLRLSTGLKVNSAIDNPSSYYTASSLTNRAEDLSALLDSMGQSVQTIKAATEGIEKAQELLELAKVEVQSALEKTEIPSKEYFENRVGENGAVVTTAEELVDAVNSGKEEICVYGTIQLNDTAITLKDNQKLVGTEYYTGYTGKEKFSKININMSDSYNKDSPIKLTGNNSILSDLSLQVNSKKGKSVVGSSGLKDTQRFIRNIDIKANYSFPQAMDQAAGINIYDDSLTELSGHINIESYVDGNSQAQGAYGIYCLGGNTEIASDSVLNIKSTSSCFINYGYTHINSGTKFNLFSETNIALSNGYTDEGYDKIQQDMIIDDNVDFYLKSKGNYSIKNQIGDNISFQFGKNVKFSYKDSRSEGVKVTSKAGVLETQSSYITGADLPAEYFIQTATDFQQANIAEILEQETQDASKYNNMLSQYDSLIKDSSYKGVNLLQADNLKVIFNENRSATLDVMGVDLSSDKIGLLSADWLTAEDVQKTLDQLTNAKNELRSAATKFGNYYSIITTREDFTENLINVLQEGSDKLTLADMNEESANMLSLQTQQQLAINSLSLASQASQAVLRLF